jgi:hypothetical protein
MPAWAGGLGRARPFGEHSNDRHQEAKEHNLFHVPPSGRWCVLGASAYGLTTGTHSDIAATDQMRPIATTTAIPIPMRICISSASRRA